MDMLRDSVFNPRLRREIGGATVAARLPAHPVSVVAIVLNKARFEQRLG